MSQTLNQMFHNTASRLAGCPALRFKTDNGWRDLTWSEVEETGQKAANALPGRWDQQRRPRGRALKHPPRVVTR